MHEYMGGRQQVFQAGMVMDGDVCDRKHFVEDLSSLRWSVTERSRPILCAPEMRGTFKTRKRSGDAGLLDVVQGALQRDTGSVAFRVNAYGVLPRKQGLMWSATSQKLSPIVAYCDSLVLRPTPGLFCRCGLCSRRTQPRQRLVGLGTSVQNAKQPFLGQPLR